MRLSGGWPGCLEHVTLITLLFIINVKYYRWEGNDRIWSSALHKFHSDLGRCHLFLPSVSLLLPPFSFWFVFPIPPTPPPPPPPPRRHQRHLAPRSVNPPSDLSSLTHRFIDCRFKSKVNNNNNNNNNNKNERIGTGCPVGLGNE